MTTTLQLETVTGDTIAAATITRPTAYRALLAAARWIKQAAIEQAEADHYVLTSGGALILLAEAGV